MERYEFTLYHLEVWLKGKWCALYAGYERQASAVEMQQYFEYCAGLSCRVVSLVY